MINVSRCSKSQVLLAAGLFVILSTQLVSQTEAYLITVDAGVENECFHERVPIGTKLGFSYEVIEGGFYDIDIEIKDPTNVILHRDERASSGKFTIEASLEGPHQFCFSNKKVSFAPKVVMFDIEKAVSGFLTEIPNVQSADSKDTKSGTPDDSEIGQLLKMVDQLMVSTIMARQDVRYLTVRDRTHRKVNEKTNRTIVWWSGVEFILLLSVSLGQVLYLKRFFEIRRKA